MTAVNKPFTTGSTFLCSMLERKKKGKQRLVKKWWINNLVSTFTTSDRKVPSSYLKCVCVHSRLFPYSNRRISINDATCLFFLNSFVIRVKWYKTTLPTRMMCFIILSRYKYLAFLCLTILLSHKIRLKLWLHMFRIRLPTFTSIYICASVEQCFSQPVILFVFSTTFFFSSC